MFMHTHMYVFFHVCPSRAPARACVKRTHYTQTNHTCTHRHLFDSLGQREEFIDFTNHQHVGEDDQEVLVWMREKQSERERERKRDRKRE